MKILLVDDDRDDVELFGEAVNEIDRSVQYVNASNGLAALELLESQKQELPDYIFLDINMPVMDGIECLEKIRQNADLSTLRIVMYSTSKHPPDYNRAIELGADYLVKPPSYSSLIETLKTKYIQSGLK